MEFFIIIMIVFLVSQHRKTQKLEKKIQDVENRLHSIEGSVGSIGQRKLEEYLYGTRNDL